MARSVRAGEVVLVGKLTYGHELAVDFDDRFLAHLQIVIGAKLARSEAFYLSWRDDPKVGDGRTAVWLHPQMTLVYKFYGSKIPVINGRWITLLTRVANSSGGLHEVEEPAAEPRDGRSS